MFLLPSHGHHGATNTSSQLLSIPKSCLFAHRISYQALKSTEIKFNVKTQPLDWGKKRLATVELGKKSKNLRLTDPPRARGGGWVLLEPNFCAIEKRAGELTDELPPSVG